MASSVKELALLNQAFYQFVNQEMPSNEDERDVFIEEIETFLEKRQALISQLEGTILPNEKELGKAVMTLHEKINERLEAFQKQLKADMNHFQLKKKQSKKYDNPYAATQNEGVFFDKRGL